MRYSLFIEPRTSLDPGHHIRETLRIAALAEQLGYDKLWVATTHFRSLGFSVSGAFPLLAAIARETSTIRLGTAVVPLTFENPIRLVEDASFVDLLSDGRVELGLGKGNSGKLANGASASATAYQAFGIDEDNADVVYHGKLTQIGQLLNAHKPLSDPILALTYPLSPGLGSRMWRGSAREEEVRKIAESGDGLLLFRPGRVYANRQTQADLIDLYRETFVAHQPEQLPRTGLSRSVLPAASAAEAHASLVADHTFNPQYYADSEPLREEFLADTDKTAFADEYFAFMGTALGSPLDVAAALAADPAVRNADELLLNIPLSLENPAYETAVRLLITDVVPALNAALERRA